MTRVPDSSSGLTSYPRPPALNESTLYDKKHKVNKNWPRGTSLRSADMQRS